MNPPKRLRIAVCIDTRDGPGRERLLGVYEYAMQRNWNLFLVRRDDAHAAEQVVQMRVDGAILYDRSPRFHRALRRHRIYCVETSARNLPLDDAAVFVDDAAVGRVSAAHLANIGLEHFAYCGPGSSVVPSARRCASFRAHIGRLGFAAESFVDVSAVGEAPLASLRRWLLGLPKPVGILAFDDKIAERLLGACRWSGVRVPDDVALVGVGNDELVCELVEPKLSSVLLPTREIGRLAAQAIEAHHQKQPVPPQRSLPPTEVIVRASSERLLKADAAVAAAIDFIRAQAHRPFGTDQLAEATGIPRRTLERRFLNGTGRTIHDFTTEYRLGLARRLLRRTHDTVSDVARQCGYAALSAFTRMFTERVGCHPDAYRRRWHQLG